MKVYLKDGQIATKNLTPGISVYGEELIQEKEEYRIWNPRRSKLAAALLNGLENLDISEDAKVLYLGASTGTTVSHISDIVTDGRIYAVEFSPTTAKKLVRLARQRTNIAPILGDATKPKNSFSSYATKIWFSFFKYLLHFSTAYSLVKLFK